MAYLLFLLQGSSFKSSSFLFEAFLHFSKRDVHWLVLIDFPTTSSYALCSSFQMCICNAPKWNCIHTWREDTKMNIKMFRLRRRNFAHNFYLHLQRKKQHPLKIWNYFDRKMYGAWHYCEWGPEGTIGTVESKFLDIRSLLWSTGKSLIPLIGLGKYLDPELPRPSTHKSRARKTTEHPDSDTFCNIWPSMKKSTMNTCNSFCENIFIMAGIIMLVNKQKNYFD